MRHPKCFVVHIFFSTALWSKTSCILVLFTAAYVLYCYVTQKYSICWFRRRAFRSLLQLYKACEATLN